MLIPKNVIIATGSRPRVLSGIEVDGEFVMTSDEALLMQQLPKSILIVGGGVIGIEWASMLSDFGVDVTVLEFADRIIPSEDKEISKEMQRLFKKKGIKLLTGAKVLSETLQKGDGMIYFSRDQRSIKEFKAEKLLISVGRQANIEGIGLENTDIQIEKGVIRTNEFYQTKETHIYAIGDVIGGLQLAHVASHEGITAVEHIADQNPFPIDYSLIPTCIYSSPEVAKVGITEEEAIEKGYKVKVGKFSFGRSEKHLCLEKVMGL